MSPRLFAGNVERLYKLSTNLYRSPVTIVPLGSWFSDLIGYAFQNVPDRSNDLGGTTMGRRSNKAFPEPRIHPAKGLLRLRVNGK